MAWKDTIWLRNKMERSKRLIGSNSSIVKGFSTVSLLFQNPVVIGSFMPKYSGSVTIISELWGQNTVGTKQYILYANGTTIYNEYVNFPASTQPHNIIYITINVTAGQEYILSAQSDSQGNNATVSVGASLSESNLVE